MNERRGPWYLITGLIIGIIGSLICSLSMFPVVYDRVPPSILKAEHKESYRELIALAYQSNGDVERARTRIKLLMDEDPVLELQKQAQKLQANAGAPKVIQALNLLANDWVKKATPRSSLDDKANTPAPVAAAPTLVLNTQPAIRTPTPAPSSTPTALMTFTPRPSATPMPAQGMKFSLSERRVVCDSKQTSNLLQVVVEDKSGQGLPGASVNVSWNNGEESFYTGLYPQINLGYADFTMTTGIRYRLRIGTSSDAVNDLAIPECKISNTASPYQGSLYLRFVPQ